jgi:hypothetical protein
LIGAKASSPIIPSSMPFPPKASSPIKPGSMPFLGGDDLWWEWH